MADRSEATESEKSILLEILENMNTFQWPQKYKDAIGRAIRSADALDAKDLAIAALERDLQHYSERGDRAHSHASRLQRENDGLRADLNSATVVLKMRGDKIARVLELIQEFNDNGWHDGAGDDLADILKGDKS